MVADKAGRARRVRLASASLLTAVIVATYALLPGAQGEPFALGSDPDSSDPSDKLDVTLVEPPDPALGSSIVVEYEGGSSDPNVSVFLGRKRLQLLSHHGQRLVARLPATKELGHAKIRVANATDRSKPYDIHIRDIDRRVPFGQLVGGIALLFLGISAFSRGSREGMGVRAAHRIARAMQHRPVAALVGAVTGLLAQSTTAVAGMLTGLLSSRLVNVTAFAASFLGAVVGASASPMLVGLLKPRDGLLLLTLGALWVSLGADRRARALGRLLFGLGMITFGLHLAVEGVQPWLSSSAVLPALLGLSSDTLSGAATAMAVGVVLTAALQGPAPVVVLLLGVMSLTQNLDAKVALFVLSGSGLGAALASLLSMRRHADSYHLTKLQLVLGVLSSLLMAGGVELWLEGARRIEPLLLGAVSPTAAFSAGMSELVLAYGIALVVSVGVLVAAVQPLGRLMGSRSASSREPQPITDTTDTVRSDLMRVLAAQEAALSGLLKLALQGERTAGRVAEYALADARSILENLLSGLASHLPHDLEGRRLAKAAWASLQTTGSLEQLLARAERFTDERLTQEAELGGAGGWQQHEPLFNSLHDLLSKTLQVLSDTLAERMPIDVESIRAHEIRINSYETETRNAFIDENLPAKAARRHVQVLELVDAYEATGNHLYRLAETLADDGEPRMSSA